MTHLGNRDAPGEPAWCGAAHVVSTYNCDASVSAIALAYLTGKVTCAACLEASPHGREVLSMLARASTEVANERDAIAIALKQQITKAAQEFDDLRREQARREHVYGLDTMEREVIEAGLRQQVDALTRDRAEAEAREEARRAEGGKLVKDLRAKLYAQTISAALAHADMTAARALLGRVVKAMESWGGEGDGSDIGAAYDAAKAYLATPPLAPGDDGRENAVHLVPMGMAEVTRAACGFRGARFTTAHADSVTCDDCRGGPAQNHMDSSPGDSTTALANEAQKRGFQ